MNALDNDFDFLKLSPAQIKDIMDNYPKPVWLKFTLKDGKNIMKLVGGDDLMMDKREVEDFIENYNKPKH